MKKRYLVLIALTVLLSTSLLFTGCAEKEEAAVEPESLEGKPLSIMTFTPEFKDRRNISNHDEQHQARREEIMRDPGVSRGLAGQDSCGGAYHGQEVGPGYRGDVAEHTGEMPPPGEEEDQTDKDYENSKDGGRIFQQKWLRHRVTFEKKL